MKQIFEYEPGFEPERYELDAAPGYRFNLRRRNFFKFLGGGVVVVLLLDKALSQESGGGARRRGGNRNLPQEISAWLHIDEKGQVTVYTGKVEVGQNARTALSQAVAEELRAPIESVQLVMGDTKWVPFDAGTFGSRTTPDMSKQLRKVSAAAREVLIDLAAEKLKVDRGDLSAADGRISTKDGKSLGYGEITKGEKLTKAIAENPPMTSPQNWKVAGHSHRKVNGPDLVTGKHKYSSDMKLPGMLHAKILRSVYPDATLRSVDYKAAEQMPEVLVVRDGNFVGVAAPTEIEARRALKSINADWASPPKISDAGLFEHLKKTGSNAQRRGNDGQAGSIEEGLKEAEIKLQQTYTVAYIAHAPLEPRAAVAQWENGELTVWTGTQRPFGVRSELASALKIPEDKIRVIMPDTGSGYGGKHTGEAAVEAARIAKAIGKPVKLVWTREEEFSWAYFRPAGVIEVSSGIKKDGTLMAWEFHNYNSGGSSIRTLYNVPNQATQFHGAQSPLRQGSYRALAATANTFARETHMDELAHAAGIDPLEFRLKNLKDERLRAVLEAAAKTFGWGKKTPEGHGFGMAGGSEKGSYLSTCAEVAVDRASGKVKVVRAVSAFECGAIVNPDQLKNQVSGAIVMGIGGAMFEHIRFESGRILNGSFSEYRVPRFSDTPQIEVVLLDRKDLEPTGAGETPIICISPAIGNAIFAATGVRLRSMPLVPNGLKA